MLNFKSKQTFCSRDFGTVYLFCFMLVLNHVFTNALKLQWSCKHCTKKISMSESSLAHKITCSALFLELCVHSFTQLQPIVIQPFTKLQMCCLQLVRNVLDLAMWVAENNPILLLFPKLYALSHFYNSDFLSCSCLVRVCQTVAKYST